jgi:uncharacterized protein (TIGR02266 family)
MTQGEPGSFPASRPARQARVQLVEALQILQSLDTGSGAAARALDAAAAASSALYEAETHAATLQASYSGVRIAIEQLGEALTALQEYEAESSTVHPATETIARTLALLYPIAKAQQRQRREVVMPAEESGERASHVPPAPEPLGRPRLPTPFSGSDKRSSGGSRVFVETDIGLFSDSTFYTGLSQDLSNGGLFVATYEPRPPGTTVSIFFVLPDGHEVEAAGIVRWTREASEDSPPGMGIAFSELDPADLQAITRFCQARPPIYHDSADET